MDSEKSLCTLCNKLVQTSNFMLHQLRCEQSCQICKTCGLSYYVNEEYEHIQDVHIPNICKFCSNYFADIQFHKCPKKPSNCKYCQKQLPLIELENHQQNCGNIHFVCKYCKIEMPQNQKDMHVPICQIKHTGRLEYFCKFCQFKLLTQNQLVEHEKDCSLKPFECPFCNLYIPENKKEKHLYYCGARTEKCCYCKTNVTLENKVQHQLECSRKRLEQRLMLEKKESNQNQYQTYNNDEDDAIYNDYLQQIEDNEANQYEEQ